MELDASRGASWTAEDTAAVYERGRPGYAEGGVDFALAPVRDRPGLRALDLGAGTGKLTRQLVARGVDTVAVDPAEGMRRALARAVPAARVLTGTAESLPLPDATVDLVTAGQAFHWFDQDRALPEIARVLRPGGVLALFYNSRDDAVEWVRALSEVVGEADREDHTSRTDQHQPYDLDPHFALEEVLRAPYEQQLDTAGLVDLIGSRSYVIRLPEPERTELLDGVAGLTRTHPQLLGRQHFWMPYVTSVQRYRLRP